MYLAIEYQQLLYHSNRILDAMGLLIEQHAIKHSLAKASKMSLIRSLELVVNLQASHSKEEHGDLHDS